MFLQTHRQVSLAQLADGSGVLEGRLSPTCLAIWQGILTPLAERRPDDVMGPDDRSIGQRWHDAFEEAGRRVLAAGDLPEHAGLPCQLIVTVSLTDLERRAGQATTHHGGILSIDEALRLAVDGTARRIAATGQRRALFARDRGCTFPGCARTAAQSEIHHVIEWIQGGRTDLENMAIACAYHNNEAPRRWWRTVMLDGVPHWQPPDWHPTRKPQRNYLHHPELLRLVISQRTDRGR